VHFSKIIDCCFLVILKLNIGSVSVFLCLILNNLTIALFSPVNAVLAVNSESYEGICLHTRDSI